MSIASKRILAKLDQLTREAMMSGSMPDPAIIRGELAKFLRQSSPSGPTAKFRPQQYRTTFNVDNYNTMVQEIAEDLHFSYAEQVDQANRLLKAIDETETRHAALMHQADILDDLLTILLLAEPKASGYFYAMLDRFRDLSKVDMSQTTAETDLNSGSVFLPMTAGSRKIPFSYLSTKPDVIVTSDDPAKVVTQGNIPGHIFGNAFTDVSNAWQYRIVSVSPDGWSGSITIPVSAMDPRVSVDGVASVSAQSQTREIYVSRIDLNGIQTSQVDVQVLYSLDGRNFLKIPGYDWLPLDGRVQSLIFSRLKMEFLRLQFRVPTPDQIPGTTQYQYVIGLKNISLYDAGFAQEAQIVSKQLTQDTSNYIRRIALEAAEVLPDGTDIDYYVAPYSASPNWLSIEPSTRLQPGAAPFVDLAESILSPRQSGLIDVTGSATLNSTRNGINFYEIATLDGTQIDETAKLYRGIDGWEKSITNHIEKVNIVNNYVTFTSNDHFQKLYIEVAEEVVTPPASVSGIDTVCTTKRPVLDDPSLNIYPPSDASAAISDYSVKSAILLSSTGLTGSGNITVLLSGLLNNQRSVVLSTSSLSLNDAKSGAHIYISQGGVAKFFRASYVSYSSGITYFTIDDPARELKTAAATYVLNGKDITTSITAVNENSFSVAAAITLSASDRIIVSYRSPLTDDENPVPASIIVKSNSDSSAIYKLGDDYTYSRETKGISRNPNGAISMSQEGRIIVRVDYTFDRSVGNYETYKTWLSYQGDGTTIDLGSAIIGLQAEESIILQTNDTQFRDLSTVSTIEGLQPGWRQLIVKSKPILTTAGAVDTTTAIYKAINATDATGNLLFGPAHFAEKIAIRTPMRMVTLFYLQTSVGKDDRSAFAISSNKVIVNYNPGAKNDILYLAAGSSTIRSVEKFQIQYSKSVTGGTNATSLLFKAVLKRLPGYTGDRTPVLKGYTLRLSY